MWYRKETYRKNQSEFNSKRFPGSAISKEIAKAWNEEPESVKQVFEAMAEMEKYNRMQALPRYEVKPQAGRKTKKVKAKATTGLSIIMEMPIAATTTAMTTTPPATSLPPTGSDRVNIGAVDSIAIARSSDGQNNSHLAANGSVDTATVRASESEASQPYVYIIDDDPTESNGSRSDCCGEGDNDSQFVRDRNVYNTAAGTHVINVDDSAARQELYSLQGSSATAAISAAPIVAVTNQQQQHQQQILQLHLHHLQQQQQLQQQLQHQYNGYPLYNGLDLNHGSGNTKSAGNDSQGTGTSNTQDLTGRRKRKN